MKHLKKICVMLVCLSMLLSYSGMALAHSGRTDASGGHHDYKNVSGLGSYHYHCGGYPAHLHKNGVCPYTDGGSSSSSSSSSTTTTKKTSKYYQLGNDSNRPLILRAEVSLLSSTRTAHHLCKCCL